MNRLQTIAEFNVWQSALAGRWDETAPCLRVCDGTGCRALGSQKVLASLREEIQKAKLETPIEVIGTGCPGFCECGPLLTVYPQRISYQKIKLRRRSRNRPTDSGEGRYYRASPLYRPSDRTAYSPRT